MTLSLRAARAAGFVLMALVISGDQWSKAHVIALAGSHLWLREICPAFNLVLTWNTGISFGMFAHIQPWMPLFLTLGTSMVVMALMVWFWRARAPAVMLALCLIMGGAAGNIIDRVRFGAVADFLDFHIGRYHWPAFNVADSSIFIGVVILLRLSIVKPSHTAGPPLKPFGD